MSWNKDLPSSNFLGNQELMNLFYQMPHKIIQHHDVEGVAQLVLADISRYLGFKRASYLIDNPDFECLKGIAGFCCHQAQDYDMWHDPHTSLQSFAYTPFHLSIRKFMDENIKRTDRLCSVNELEKVGAMLDIHQPCVHTWKMRHGNRGILLYEKGERVTDAEEVLDRATALLGLCPIHI